MITMQAAAVSTVLRAWRPTIRTCRLSSTCDLPVIRVARRTQLWLEKAEKQRHRSVVAPRAGKLLISTRRRELNQAATEICSRWEQPALVSGGWKHRDSRGDHFIIHRQQEQREWPETGTTFRALGLDVKVVSAVEASNISTPTWAQKELIPSLLRGQNVLCAAETGSGKTLAYVLPIMHKLVTETDHCPGNPRSLVLVPTRQLAGQVTSVARKLGGHLGITVQYLAGGQGRRATDKQLGGAPADILVATPGILCKALRWNQVSLADLHYIVLDEADTLFDRTFSDLVGGILANSRIASHSREVGGQERKAQLAIIGATFPKGIDEILSKVMDVGSIHTIKSAKLHFLLPHVQHTFMKVKGEDKIAELIQMLKKHSAEKPGAGVLIFCNTSQTVNWLGYVLDDHGIQHDRLHGQMPANIRLGVFEAFQKSQSGVLVSTDIVSRGLDSCRAGTVVNFDFPFTIEDYLHRAGRVGRVGSQCQSDVLSFVTHAWDVEQVQAIEMAARKRSSLPTLKSRKDSVPSRDNQEDELNDQIHSV